MPSLPATPPYFFLLHRFLQLSEGVLNVVPHQWLSLVGLLVLHLLYEPLLLALQPLQLLLLRVAPPLLFHPLLLLLLGHCLLVIEQLLVKFKLPLLPFIELSRVGVVFLRSFFLLLGLMVGFDDSAFPVAGQLFF